MVGMKGIGRVWIVLGCLALLTGCGHGSHADEAAHEGDKKAHHGGHHGGGHHGGPASGPASQSGGHHHHAGPLKAGDLKPLMQEMLKHATELRGALDGGQIEAVAKHADHLAKICGDEGPVNADAAVFGADFQDWDLKLHTRAAKLATEAQQGNLEGARTGFNGVVEACVGCHGQAPVASEVDLSVLTAPLP